MVLYNGSGDGDCDGDYDDDDDDEDEDDDEDAAAADDERGARLTLDQLLEGIGFGWSLQWGLQEREEG